MQQSIVLHPSHERGHVKMDWLESHHSFSFASFYDPRKMGFGALRVINDDIIEAHQGFGTHPHQDMEIITIPLQGSVLHQDSLGTKGTVSVGEVQLMAAGTGIRHSEHNPEAIDLKLFQIWIMPNKNGLKPNYQQMSYTVSAGKVTWLVSPSETYQGDKTLVINQDAYIGIVEFDGSELEIDSPSEDLGTYLLVVDGQIDVNGTKLDARDAIGHWDKTTRFKGSKGSKVIIFHVPR
ncbi:MAG: hypothetical protein COW01_13890 [Bdellovibrionales bacterium CG12_big_fil_rev_8_21_14_0_65_38_15]|nr:MAG: hypothetical protein COW79_16710 [Bdellovibrionales bacterium CG22_combo_CG10-13_8_21_14_all_38_13]PIQ53363.1 MAG: hypothetical protein COW01_13890 [Bdellovibrionales bacterium CG12_big_fil_rev_8_21_14_0_65_38_15]PIR30273.1 MAG: hypothetical protein COV38_05865 [Bdellovibrionales bacterium CG11_big_fil_rev_8_21_14_0_20_38_13]